MQIMHDEKGRMDEAAERLGVAVGKVLRMGMGLISGFGEGLKEGMRSEEEEAQEAAQEAPEPETPETPSEQGPSA